MRPGSPLFQAPILPSPAQTALAMILLRSKPTDVTVRDFVLQLRTHYKSGRTAVDPADYGHYLDLACYWKEQCQRAQDECERLQSINIRLERSNQSLSQRMSVPSAQALDTATDERPMAANSTRPGTANATKRKAPASPSKSSKRPRVPAAKASEPTVAQTQESIENDFEFLEGLGADGSALVDALFATYQLCRASSPNAEHLCRHLVRTSSALAKIISLIAQDHEYLSRQVTKAFNTHSTGQGTSVFSHALTISARAFMSVLVGITKMAHVSDDIRLPSLVVCELAETFKSGLLAIESSARDTADRALILPPSTNNGKAKASKGIPRESLAARTLAHFLIGVMGFLEKQNMVHQQLFDAFSFHLLERVGKRLYYCTFSRHRSASIEKNLECLPQTRGAAGKATDDAETLGIRFELKALVLILDRAMGLAPHHMNATNGKSARSSDANRLGRTLSMKTLPSAPKGRLSSLAKDRLQRTLVSCMYGDKQDDELLDVLIKPVPAMRLASLPNVAKIDHQDVEEWYKEEVWRLLGWDIMAREGGW
ncbi:hypothetical protein ACEQ8H_008101 [Pleosporales sp. CAS-2024a]